jgi:hypothetical protein
LVSIILSKKKWLRIVSVTLLIVSCIAIYDGYKCKINYLEYKEYVKQNPAEFFDFYDFLEKKDFIQKNK